MTPGYLVAGSQGAFVVHFEELPFLGRFPCGGAQHISWSSSSYTVQQKPSLLQGQAHTDDGSPLLEEPRHEPTGPYM